MTAAVPPCTQLRNIGRQRNRGVELSLDYSPLSTLQLSGAFSVVDVDNLSAPSVRPTGRAVGLSTLPDNAQAGLARFHTDKAGRYRVAITSGHWIDIVDGKQLIKSRDFQGARGCERPHKIVEYELPAGRELTIQVSGAPDASVVLSVTRVASAPSA
jgi:TonB dependent receptor